MVGATGDLVSQTARAWSIAQGSALQAQTPTWGRIVGALKAYAESGKPDPFLG